LKGFFVFKSQDLSVNFFAGAKARYLQHVSKSAKKIKGISNKPTWFDCFTIRSTTKFIWQGIMHSKTSLLTILFLGVLTIGFTPSLSVGAKSVSRVGDTQILEHGTGSPADICHNERKSGSFDCR
jgi:hypothetical protein